MDGGACALSPGARETEERAGARTGSEDRQADLAQERPVPYRRTAVRPTVVSPDLDDIHQRATEVAYNAYRIFRELQEQGYPGGYEMVKLAVRPLRATQDRLAEAPLRV